MGIGERQAPGMEQPCGNRRNADLAIFRIEDLLRAGRGAMKQESEKQRAKAPRSSARFHSTDTIGTP